MSRIYTLDDGTEVTRTEYLYGVGVEIAKVPEDIIMRRVEDLSDTLGEVLEHSFHTRDKRRVEEILDEIKVLECINDS